MRKTLLWLFVIVQGIAFGAGLYEARVAWPLWLQATPDGLIWNAPAAMAANSGMRFWAFVTTGPLTLLTLANLFLALKSKGTLRKWWLAAIGIGIVERLLTFSFFIPTMIGLMDTGVTSEAAIVARAVTWERMNCLRHVLAFSAWMASMKTFALFYQGPRKALG